MERVTTTAVRDNGCTLKRTALAETMAELGISQGELHRRTRLSRMTVFDAYHGHRTTSPGTWIRIALALAVPLSRICPDEDTTAFDGLAV